MKIIVAIITVTFRHGVCSNLVVSGLSKILLFWSLAMLGVCATTLSVQAANHYVRVGASGSNNGADWTNAFNAIPSGTSYIRGDTYYVADGTYSYFFCSTPASGTSLITIKKATVADHGTSTGWSNTYGDGTAEFAAGSSTNGAIGILTNYWLIDGQTGGGPSSWTTGFGFKFSHLQVGAPTVYIGSGSNITIRHAEIEGDHGNGHESGNMNDGIVHLAGDNFTVSYCYLHDFGRCPLLSNGYTNGFMVEYSYFGAYGLNPDGLHNEILSVNGDNSISPHSLNYTFRYNLFTWIASTGGLIMHSVDNAQIYGNVFIQNNSDGGGNGAVGTWTAGTVTNMKVYNNSFIGLHYRVLGILDSNDSGEFKNNIIYNCQVGDVGQTAHDYNHYINVSDMPSESHRSTATANPFANIQALNFTLTSPTTVGFALPAPFNTDPTGRIRSTWSRGAYEYGSSASSTPTPTPNPTATPAPTATPTPAPTATPNPTPASNSIVFDATSGAITAPFVSQTDYIYQSVDTEGDPSTSGRAVYTFNVITAGVYGIQITVDAPNPGQNSILINIDGDPTEPSMVCDISVTTGFLNRLISWRGSGTFESNEFAPKTFNLTTGTHQLIVLGREANTKLKQFAVVKIPDPPAGLQLNP